MEKVLFAVIGVFLASISGIGIYAAIQHPEETRALVPEAIEVVKSATNDAVSAVMGTPSEAVAPAQNAPVTPSAVTAQDDTGTSVSRHREDDEDDDEDEDEDEDRTSPSASPPNTSSGSAKPNTQTTQPTPSTQATVKTFTMAQIATHNSSASCYSAISGSVYDLTSFISQHPGGQAAIKSLCGVDGTTAYNAQHGGSSRPANELASLKIGVLAN